MENFKLIKFTDEGAKLLADVTAEFKRLKIDTASLPKVFPDDSGKIKLVFVGQYGAGKSSIIKMLTGEDLEIGAAITTQTSTPYEWHGLEIIDTPGIHTELRPDHDEITYDQINHAALLIFVITNEGFSDRMGKHFINLAVEQKRAQNMVLVVNKMDRTAQGNVPAQQKIIYEDLKKVTAPHDPKDLYLSFLDTTSYFKALEERDERRKKRRLEKSGYDIFVENLNRFVAAEGVLQQIILPLNTIAAAIRAVSGGLSAEEKLHIEGLIEDISRRKKIFQEGRKNCLDYVNANLTQLKAEISQLGRDTAEKVLNSGSKEKAEEIFQSANAQISEIVKRHSNNINDDMKKSFEAISVNVERYNGSVFVQQLNANIAKEIDKESSSGRLVPGGVGAVAGGLIVKYGAQYAAPFAVQQAIGLAAKVRSFSPLVENKVAQVVANRLSQEVGSFLGNLGGKIAGKAAKFGWEKIFTLSKSTTDKIAHTVAAGVTKLGYAIGILGAAWTVYSLIQDDNEKKEQEIKQRKARQEIISQFDDSANYVSQQLADAAENCLAENVDKFIAECDKDIKLLKAQTADAQIKSEKLNALLKRTENLIDEIQACK